MSFPPIMWAIFALGIVFVILRVFAGRAEERRRAGHEERMARLLEEQEAALHAEHAPRSLEGLASDSSLAEGQATEPDAPRVETVKIRCRACRALNDESATSCAKCGLEL